MKWTLPLLALAACSPTEKPAEQAPIGLPNPAAVHCAEKGGKSEIRQEAGGARGYCHLPDGGVVDEWELFRADKGKETANG